MFEGEEENARKKEGKCIVLTNDGALFDWFFLMSDLFPETENNILVHAQFIKQRRHIACYERSLRFATYVNVRVQSTRSGQVLLNYFCSITSIHRVFDVSRILFLL